MRRSARFGAGRLHRGLNGDAARHSPVARLLAVATISHASEVLFEGQASDRWSGSTTVPNENSRNADL